MPADLKNVSLTFRVEESDIGSKYRGHVSDSYMRTDRTGDWYTRSFIDSGRCLSFHIFFREDIAEDARPIRRFISYLL